MKLCITILKTTLIPSKFIILLKNILLIILIVSINLTLLAQTDSNAKKHPLNNISSYNLKFDIKLDLLLPIVSAFERRTTNALSLEVCFLKRFGLQVTTLFSGYSGKDRKETSLQFIPEYRFYFNKQRIYSGFYSGLYFKMNSYFYQTNTLEYQKDSYGGGILVGYKIYFKTKWLFDGTIGFGKRKTISTDIMKDLHDSYSSQPEKWSVDGIAGLKIGYEF